MALRVGDDENGGFSEINITPLLDVLIVLLAISLVTGAALAPGLLDVTLPTASGTEAAGSAEPVTVTVDAIGQFAVETRLSSRDRLEEDLRSALATRGTKEVVVAGDRQAALEAAVFVLEVARRAGAERASIATAGAPR